MPRPDATGTSPSKQFNQTLQDPSVKYYKSGGVEAGNPAAAAKQMLSQDVRDASRVSVPGAEKK